MSTVKPLGQFPAEIPDNQVPPPSSDDPELPEGYTPPLVHGGLFVDRNWAPRLADRLGSVRTDFGVAEHWPRDIAPVMYPHLPNSFWIEVPTPEAAPPDAGPPDPPTLTSATPSSGAANTATTLAGTNLSDVTTIVWLTGSDVEIGTSTSFTIVSATQIDTTFNGPKQMGGKVAVRDSAGQQSNSVPGFSFGSLAQMGASEPSVEAEGTGSTPEPAPEGAQMASEPPEATEGTNPSPEPASGPTSLTEAAQTIKEGTQVITQATEAIAEGTQTINQGADAIAQQAEGTGQAQSSEDPSETAEQAEMAEMTEYEMDQMWGIGTEGEPEA
jgi:hypothetical protein